MKKKLLFSATGIGAIAVVAGLLANAATTAIKVTTADDENGENPAACSLREAVIAANTRQEFGGCPAGSIVGENVIQLEGKDYVLSDSLPEITPKVGLVIAGATTWRRNEVNPLTGFKPNRVRPGTLVPEEEGSSVMVMVGASIKAGTGKRVFNTTGSSSALTLRDIRLIGSGTDVSGKGGLIYSSGSVNFDNVHMQGGRSAQDGGAIFLASGGASFSASESTFEGNRSGARGGLIAMNCEQDLSLLAQHDVAFSQSLVKDNFSASGAAVVHACGNTTVSVTASTLSGNESAAGSAAITYEQTSTQTRGYGAVSLDYVTAVNQVGGPVVRTTGIASLTVNASILAWNVAGNCAFGATLPSTRSSTYNALDDTSCNPIASGTTNNQTITNNIGDELAPLGPHEGLTDVYLPLTSSLFVVDKGLPMENCAGTDQRGVARNSGAACDIGAAERLRVTAAPITAANVSKTDRLAIVNVMASAKPGESEATVYELRTLLLPQPSDTTDPDFMYDATLYGGSDPKCKWHDDTETDEKLRRRLVVNTGGQLTGATPVVCQYKVKDSNDDESAPSTVTAEIKNFPPVAKSDVYVRPVGITSISLNPVENDTDEGDGSYGESNWWGPTDLDVYIYVAEANKPGMGKLTAAAEGPCVDSTLSSPKVCYRPPLTYTANDPNSPFSDRFTYSVYDKDGSSSSSATVTIETDAPDPDKGETGSFDSSLLVLLALLGWRRARHYRF